MYTGFSGPKMTPVVICGYTSNDAGGSSGHGNRYAAREAFYLVVYIIYIYIYIYIIHIKRDSASSHFRPSSHHQSSEVKERTPTADPSSITSFLRLEAKNEHLDLYRPWGRLEYRLDIWLTSMRQNLHLLLSFIHAIQAVCLKNYPLQKLCSNFVNEMSNPRICTW